MNKEYKKQLDDINQYIRRNGVERKTTNLHTHIMNILNMVRELTKLAEEE